MSDTIVNMVYSALTADRPVYHSRLDRRGRPRCGRRRGAGWLRVRREHAIKFADPCSVCFAGRGWDMPSSVVPR